MSLKTAEFVVTPFLGAVKGLTPIVKGLRAADFGTKAVIKVLDGTLKLDGKVATVFIRNLEGNLGNPWKALSALKDTARSQGASTLRIEATIANPDLLIGMERILGPASRGAPGAAQDVWNIAL